jgi:lysine/ornithine N-monooxygenase
VQWTAAGERCFGIVGVVLAPFSNICCIHEAAMALLEADARAGCIETVFVIGGGQARATQHGTVWHLLNNALLFGTVPWTAASERCFGTVSCVLAPFSKTCCIHEAAMALLEDDARAGCIETVFVIGGGQVSAALAHRCFASQDPYHGTIIEL